MTVKWISCQKRQGVFKSQKVTSSKDILRNVEKTKHKMNLFFFGALVKKNVKDWNSSAHY